MSAARPLVGLAVLAVAGLGAWLALVDVPSDPRPAAIPPASSEPARSAPPRATTASGAERAPTPARAPRQLPPRGPASGPGGLVHVPPGALEPPSRSDRGPEQAAASEAAWDAVERGEAWADPAWFPEGAPDDPDGEDLEPPP